MPVVVDQEDSDKPGITAVYAIRYTRCAKNVSRGFSKPVIITTVLELHSQTGPWLRLLIVLGTQESQS